jgi:citrate synthase
MTRTRRLKSAIAWSDASHISVWEHDLVRDLIGRVNLGDMGFLEIRGRLPNARESRMFNALVVTLVKHGTVPSTLAARMTVAGASVSPGRSGGQRGTARRGAKPATAVRPRRRALRGKA